MTLIKTQPRTIDDVIDALQTAASRVSGSIASLTVIMRDGRIFSGTAYCVDKRGYFVTALHCVQGDMADAFIAMDALHPVTVIAVDEKTDLALLKVEGTTCDFEPVMFAQSAPAAEEIVGGLGYPGGQLSVSLESFLVRCYGAITDGIGPEGFAINGNKMQNGLCFVGAQMELAGYSGGPIVNEHGEVVSSVSKGCTEASFVMGPSAADIVAFISQYI
jgi:S1-C subfamily serine protease